MLASDVNLTPLRGKSKDRVELSTLCCNLLGDVRCPDPYEFNGAITPTITGRCLALDMNKEEDRERYADLVAVCRSGDGSMELVWEEHVPTPDGGLFVYVCFTEMSRIPGNMINN